MSNELKYTLDTSKEQYTLQKCKQLDNRPLVCKIYDRGQSYNLSNTTVELRAFKPDGTFVIQSDNITISGNTITINPINIDIVRIAGVVKLELRLTKSGQSVSSFTFELVVLPSAIPDGTLESKNLVTIIEELNNTINSGNSTLSQVEQATLNLNNLISSGGAVKSYDETLKTNSKYTIGAINESFSLINDISVNIKSFGAVGDGVTDDTQAIVDAIDYAVTNSYGTVFCPKPDVSYKCKNGIIVPIDKINFIGANSAFDFRENTDEYCFRLKCSSLYVKRYTHKNIFEGIQINPYQMRDSLGNLMQIQSAGIYIDGNDLTSDNWSQDNFTISRCSIFSCKYGIKLGSHAWRLKFEDNLLLWNEYHIYEYNGIDTGENIHFISCMFADGGKVDVTTVGMMFSDCSFDTCSLYFRNSALAMFEQCHFENPPSVDNHIINPFLSAYNKSNVTLNECFIILNSKICDVCPIQTATSDNVNTGITLTNCMLPLDPKNYNLPAFIARGDTLQLVSGLARIRANNNFALSNDKMYIPISSVLNLFDNGDILKDGYIPIKLEPAGGGTIEVTDDAPYHWSACMRMTCTPTQNYYGYIDVPCNPQDNICVSVPCRIKSGNGHICITISFIREDGVLLPKPYYVDNTDPFKTMSDTSGAWNIVTTGHTVPPGAIKARVHIQLLNTSNYNPVGDTSIADFDQIVINAF